MIKQILHGLRDLIVFVTKLRLIFVQGSWKRDLQLMMVSLHSSEIFRLLLLLRFHGNNRVTNCSFLQSECSARIDCVSVRHASASVLTLFMFSSASLLSMAEIVEAVSEG